MHAITKNNIQEIKTLLERNKKIVITSHHNPDGDAVGSMLGLHFILLEFGLESKMIIPNEIPNFLAWLPNSSSIIRYSKNKELARKVIGDADVLFALDFNGVSRLEKMASCFGEANGKKILIDHHPEPEDSFNYYLSETNASSTAELVFEFADLIFEINNISADAALSIFTGIMTDTGSFSYGCSNPRTFEIVAKLISLGVSVENVQAEVYNNFSEGKMRLLGYSLSNKMKVFPEHRAAYISLTREELKRFNYKIGDTEGLVNYPLSIGNIVFSALFVENSNFVKVSLRSRGNFPANRVSAEFYNGGGHLNAAGGKSFATLNETEDFFITILQRYTKELNL